MTDENLVAIDWSNAYVGNPLGDVMRTCLTLLIPSFPAVASFVEFIFHKIIKQCLYINYVKEYCKLSKIRRAELDAWLLPLGAMRLAENVPKEEQWLLNIIDNRLKAYVSNKVVPKR